MIEGAIIAIVGVIVGRYLPNRKKSAKNAGSPEAVCGCTHHMALHDPKLGICHGQVRNPAYEPMLNAGPTNVKTVQCSCKQYAGPLPVERFFSTPVLPPQE